MSRHDYTKHSKKNQNEVTKLNEVNEEPESEAIAPTEDLIEDVEIEAEEVQQPVESKTYDLGKVVNCKKLRVRSEPRFGDNVVCELDYGTSVMIDKSESTFDYYKIYTETGIEGYCQKTYIA